MVWLSWALVLAVLPVVPRSRRLVSELGLLGLVVDKDLYWIAGLLEGEGSFIGSANRHGRPYPQITLAMTDRDVVEKAAAIMEAPSVKSSQYVNNRHGKLPMWRFTINGDPAIEWMEALEPIMGQRRHEQIGVILEIYSCW